MVVSSLHRHSKDSSSWFFSSLTTQSCMMASVNILSLKSSPMNLMLPMERLRALSLASSSSSWRRSRSVVWRDQGNVNQTVKQSFILFYDKRFLLPHVPMQQSPAPSASSRTPRRPPCLSQTPSDTGLAAACESWLWCWVCLSWALWAAQEQKEEKQKKVKQWDHIYTQVSMT